MKLNWKIQAITILVFASVMLYASYADTQDTRKPILDQLKSLTVEPETDCGKHYSRYEKVYSEYRSDDDLENRIVRFWDKGVYSPYDKVTYDNIIETDIEHLIGRKQAHLSGFACRNNRGMMRSFVTDLNNLVTCTPEENRGAKKDYDASGYLPKENTCWFAAQAIKVKYLYNLSVDKLERDALLKTVSNCTNFRME